MDNNTTIPTTLDQALVGIINKTTNSLDSAFTFLSEQIPDVVQQLLLWHLTYSLILTIIGITLASVTTYVLIKYSGKGVIITQETASRWPKYKDTLTHDEDGEIHPRVMATSVIAIVVYIIALHLITLTWLQILIAPKIFLIEYAASLIK